MNVVATGCAAPNNFFLAWVELHEADWTLSFHRLAIAICFMVLDLVFHIAERGVVVDLADFLNKPKFTIRGKALQDTHG